LDNQLYAINGKSGVKLWEFETGSYVHSSPAIGSDGTVYVGARDKKLYAINGKSGVKLWEFVTGDEVSSSPAIGPDGTVYVGSTDKKLYALNGKSGVKLWEFETGSGVGSSPAIGSDGTVYVGSTDKKLYALNGKSGVKLWEFKTGYYVSSSPAIGSDGTVYVGSYDGKVYALKTDSKGLAKSPWPMRGQNAQHTGRAPDQGLTSPPGDTSSKLDPKLIAQGKVLFLTKICFTCHQTDPAVPAPAGLALKAPKFIGDFWGKEREVQINTDPQSRIFEDSGKTAMFNLDDAYFLESVEKPMVKVVKGARPGCATLPTTPEERRALLEYVTSLSKK
jgi:hypothetical protein